MPEDYYKEQKSPQDYQFYTMQQEIDSLKRENYKLKTGLKHYKRAMFKINSIACECNNSKEWKEL